MLDSRSMVNSTNLAQRKVGLGPETPTSLALFQLSYLGIYTYAKCQKGQSWYQTLASKQNVRKKAVLCANKQRLYLMCIWHPSACTAVCTAALIFVLEVNTTRVQCHAETARPSQQMQITSMKKMLLLGWAGMNAPPWHVCHFSWPWGV